MIRTCTLCGKQFDKKYNTKGQNHFCSKKCQDKYRQRNSCKHKTAESRCVVCGGALPHGSYKFCSPTCSRSYWIKKSNEKKHPIHKKFCENCGHEFETTKTNKKFCSPKCVDYSTRRYTATEDVSYSNNRAKVTPTQKKCKHCGDVFYSAYRHKVYCTDRCRRLHNAPEKKPERKEHTIHYKSQQCSACGQRFLTSDPDMKKCYICNLYDPKKKKGRPKIQKTEAKWIKIHSCEHTLKINGIPAESSAERYCRENGIDMNEL